VTAANFPTWWQFCQLPEHDGQAQDGPDTRWGWTFSTWITARRWYGYRSISRATFNAQTQAELGTLTNAFFWSRQGGILLPAGLDVSVIDWVWTSGGAVMDIQQNLGDVTVDGYLGPQTAAALQVQADPLQLIHDWRVAYYEAIGLVVANGDGTYSGEDPGLGERADDCLELARQLAAAT
jgi:lysozyme family protein